MGKVIKKGIGDDTGFQDLVSTDEPTRRAPIIERATVEAKDEASEIITKAKSEAEQIIQAAEEKAKHLEAEAHERGFSEGKEEGASQLLETVTKASKRIQQTEDALSKNIKDLAIGIAKKILGQELQSNPDAVVALVKQALTDKARQRKEISLRINPEDLEHIRSSRSELLEVLSRCREISIREDPDVARFGVIIETEAGTIDAQLETQLEAIQNVLRAMP
ncbi:MAG: FliH/SctL family protein [Myxococcota bacterium]|nr:FliH/SctL family protein [Myxococcota bacterium]